MAELDASNNYYRVTECAVDIYRILAEPHIWRSGTRCSHPQLFSIIKQNILSSNLKISSELNKIRNTVDVIYKTYLFHCFAFILSVLCETPAVLLQFWTEGIVALGFLFTVCYCNVLRWVFFFFFLKQFNGAPHNNTYKLSNLRQ